jgi:hypothetical protein
MAAGLRFMHVANGSLSLSNMHMPQSSISRVRVLARYLTDCASRDTWPLHICAFHMFKHSMDTRARLTSFTSQLPVTLNSIAVICHMNKSNRTKIPQNTLVP